VFVPSVPPPPAPPPPSMTGPGLPPLPSVPPPQQKLSPLEQLDLAAKLAMSVFDDIAAHKFQYDRNLLKQFQAAASLEIDGKYGGRSAGGLQYFTGKPPPPPYYDPKTIITYRPPGMSQAVQASQTTIPQGTPAPIPTRAAPVRAIPRKSVPTTPHRAPLPRTAPGAPPPVESLVTPLAKRLALAKLLAQAVYDDLSTKNVMQLGMRAYDQDLLKQFQTAAGIHIDGIYGKESAGAMNYYIQKYVHTPNVGARPKPYTPPTSA